MIHHIDAHNGSIRFYKDGGVVAQANNSNWIAYILNTHGGFDENASFSSSMQFASEEGFENDDTAMDMLIEGMGAHGMLHAHAKNDWKVAI
tara:strand:- start:592 stop:864 length:273 start_codon:yes stop_codon:yes gene_type:complete